METIRVPLVQLATIVNYVTVAVIVEYVAVRKGNRKAYQKLILSQRQSRLFPVRPLQKRGQDVREVQAVMDIVGNTHDKLDD